MNKELDLLLRHWAAIREPTREKHPGLYVRAGACPVVFSAPHSVPTLRRGERKLAEPGTAHLASVLSLHFGGTGIWRLGPREGALGNDPSTAGPEEGYRRTLEHNIGLGCALVDVHGMHDRHGCDVVLGIGDAARPGITDVALDLALSLTREGLGVRVGEPFPAYGPDTLTGWAHSLGAWAMQIEVAHWLRCPDVDPEATRRLLRGLLAGFRNAPWAPGAGAPEPAE